MDARHGLRHLLGRITVAAKKFEPLDGPPGELRGRPDDVLDIPEHQIGSSDHKHGVAWRTFFPPEGNGGSDGGAVTR